MKLVILYSIISLSLFTSCVDGNYYEKNQAIPNREWDYATIPSFAIHVTERGSKFDVFINLRHTGDYDFSNIHVLLHQKGPNLLDTVQRREITLAELDGKWLGNSAGVLYDIQYLAVKDLVIPDTGLYTFSIEQSMRQNPLKDVSDVGIKLIKK